MTPDRPVLLITAGPSREAIDDVRFLTNASSGRMGIEIARAGIEAGWETHLALGPVDGPLPDAAHIHRFQSARDLEAICDRLWPRVDGFVATAAVCDYRPADRIPGKRKKEPGEWLLRLVPNPDVLAQLSTRKGNRVLVGFALESPPDRALAVRKLVKKNLDLILLNAPASLGRESADYTWIEAGGRTCELGTIAKSDLAARILRYLGEAHAARRGESPHPMRTDEP